MTDQPSVESFRSAPGRAGLSGEMLALLPSGRVLDLGRPRSEGPLDPEELAWCRSRGVPLLYDPAQVGWLPAGAADDLAMAHAAQRKDRLRLRPWREEDLGVYVRLLDDPTVWTHLPEPYPDPLTPELARDLIAISGEGTHHEVLAVEAEGEVVGQVRLAFGPADEGEISYWLGRAHWRRGIASELVALFTARSFRQRPGLRVIVARVHEGNTASARVLEKAGYRETGRASGQPGWRLFRKDRPPT